MAYTRIKFSKGRPYLYLVESYRENGKVKQRVLEYLGSVNIGQKIQEIESAIRTSEFEESENQKRADWNQEGKKEYYEEQVKREQEDQKRLKKKLKQFKHHQKKLGTTSKVQVELSQPQWRYKSRYRGGSVTKPYVAVVEGKDPKYKLKRKFLKGKDKDKDKWKPNYKETEWKTELKKGEIIEKKNPSGLINYYMVWPKKGSSDPDKNVIYIPDDSYGDIENLADKSLKERSKIVQKEIEMQQKDPDESGNFDKGLYRFMYYDTSTGKRTEYTGEYFEKERPKRKYGRSS